MSTIDFDNSAMTIAILAGATLIVTVLVLIAVLHMNRMITSSMPGQTADDGSTNVCKHGHYDERTRTCRPHHGISNFLTYGGDLNQYAESHGKFHTRTRSNRDAKAPVCPNGMWSDGQEQCIGRSFGGPASDLVQTTAAMDPRDPVEDMFRKYTHLDD